MIPLLDTAQMRAADAAAVAEVGQDALVARAGHAVGRAARDLLGPLYGRRVVVLAGPGLNGADGRVAAEWLAGRGAQVRTIEVADAPKRLPRADLVVDAAFGIGLSRPFRAPDADESSLILAVDVPSGVDADTGEVLGHPMVADATIALGAMKRAHVTGPAFEFVGEVSCASLGIAAGGRDGVVEDGDLADFARSHRDDHKWRHAVLVVAGQEAMPGAALLATVGAQAGGASLVRVCVPGVKPGRMGELPAEAIRVPSSVAGLRDLAVTVSTRLHAVVVGPGLGRDPEIRAEVRALVRRARVPVVLDADGLHAVDVELLASRDDPTSTVILTPHDGEYTALAGHEPGPDRIEAATSLACATRCLVLLKGPVTVVAAPDGATRVVRAGTPALATAGSGDVLAGLIGGALARGHRPLDAAALSAHLHGLAGRRLPRYGTAHQLVPAVARCLAELHRAG